MKCSVRSGVSYALDEILAGSVFIYTPSVCRGPPLFFFLASSSPISATRVTMATAWTYIHKRSGCLGALITQKPWRPVSVQPCSVPATRQPHTRHIRIIIRHFEKREREREQRKMQFGAVRLFLIVIVLVLVPASG